MAYDSLAHGHGQGHWAQLSAHHGAGGSSDAPLGGVFVYYIAKLKPDREFGMLLIAVSVLAVFLLIRAYFGLNAGAFFLSAVYAPYALYSFVTFARTGNTGFVIVSLFQASASAMLFTAATNSFVRTPLSQAFSVFTLFFLVWTIGVAATKRIKWRGREVLELAAAPVERTGNGYTTRPLPAGKTDFAREDIISFARFAAQNLIAVTYLGRDRLVLVPVVMGREFPFITGLKSDYTDETWVSFGFDGDVTVNISHRDYLRYKEALSFDQLCNSLGNLFVEFLDTFRRGEGVRIIDRMNALGIGMFS